MKFDRQILIDNTPLVTFILIAMTMIIGYSTITCGQFEFISDTRFIQKEESSFFLLGRIFIKNTTFAILLIMGSLFFNISTFSLVAFNGYSWGHSFREVLCQTDIKTTLLIFSPHGILEIVWICLFAKISVNISISLVDLLRNKILSTIFIDSLKLLYPKLFLGFFLIFTSAVIEVFLTPILI
jgi:uncharacterized membrane protein SpoIIM required for sporulation